MTWQADMVQLLRSVIDDMESPYIYTSNRLQSLLVSSAYFVNSEVDFPYTYTVNIADTGISPDPTAHNDYGFVNLTVLKAACILARSEAKNEARKGGISIKDGPATIDTKTRAEHYKAMSKEMCEAYEQAELEYRLGNARAGHAIVGPHRTYLTDTGDNGFNIGRH